MTTIRCICQGNHCWQVIIRFSFVPVVYVFRTAAALFVAQKPQLSKPASSLTVPPMITPDADRKKGQEKISALFSHYVVRLGC